VLQKDDKHFIVEMPDIGQRIEFARGGEQLRAHEGRVFDQCEHFCFTGEKFPSVFFGQRDHITRQHIHSATVDVITGAKNPAIGTRPIADGDFNTCVEAERLVMDTIEGDPDHARLALEQIGSVGLSDRITVHHGDFAAVLPTLAAGYGLIFFDGFAPDIIVLEWLTQVLDPGGMLVCANLGLASNRRHLMALLDDTAVWMKEDPIEGGATVVRVKRR